MRALVCKEHGSAAKLSLEIDWPTVAPGAGDVVIDVKAAGLNFPDTLIIENKYQLKPELPFVPGGECAGVVVALGDDVDSVNLGDEVIAISPFGAFRDRLTVPAATVIKMPGGVGFREAAGVSITYLTSYHALKQRGRLQAGETVLVLGAAGGVGIAAVELAKAMGATVIAAASTDEKLQLAKKMGADHLVNYSDGSLKDKVREIIGERGVDIVYDPVGGDFSEQALRCMAWKGRFLVIGFASGPIPKIPLNLALLKGCEIVGVFWGAFIAREPDVSQQNISEVWAMLSAGKLKPLVTNVFPLEEYEQAFNCLTQRRARGKVIIEMTP